MVQWKQWSDAPLDRRFRTVEYASMVDDWHFWVYPWRWNCFSKWPVAVFSTGAYLATQRSFGLSLQLCCCIMCIGHSHRLFSSCATIWETHWYHESGPCMDARWLVECSVAFDPEKKSCVSSSSSIVVAPLPIAGINSVCTDHWWDCAGTCHNQTGHCPQQSCWSNSKDIFSRPKQSDFRDL